MTGQRVPKSMSLVARDGERVEAGAPETAPAEAPKLVAVKAPGHLTGIAKDEFERVANLMQGARRWSPQFRVTLELYARAYQRLREAERQAGLMKNVIAKTPNAYAQISATYVVIGRERETLIKLGDRLGLNLLSAAKLADAQLDLFNIGDGSA